MKFIGTGEKTTWIQYFTNITNIQIQSAKSQQELPSQFSYIYVLMNLINQKKTKPVSVHMQKTHFETERHNFIIALVFLNPSYFFSTITQITHGHNITNLDHSVNKISKTDQRLAHQYPMKYNRMYLHCIPRIWKQKFKRVRKFQ